MATDIHDKIRRSREGLTLSASDIAEKRAALSQRASEIERGITALSDDDSGITADPILCVFRSDLHNTSFHRRACITFPSLTDVVVSKAVATDSEDVIISVRSPFFAEHDDCAYTVSAHQRGIPIGECRFESWYGQHQFFVPFHQLRGGDTIELKASPSRVNPRVSECPAFSVEIFIGSKSAQERRIEDGTIWLFSTARSGSTWLAADLLCANDRARLMDEPGVGRMFAPVQMDPERFFDLGADWRCRYSESGFEYETRQASRERSDRLPTFERAFFDMRRENQVLRTQNFEFYHRALRDITVGHIFNEWGCRDFSRVVLKCPNEGHAADFIMRAFPRSHMIFLMRDGRDVMRSRFSPFASPLLAETTDKALRRYAIAFYSHWWNFQVDIIQSAYDNHDALKRYFLKYENLRVNTEQEITILFKQIDIQASPEEISQLVASTALEAVPEAERGPDKPRQTGAVSGYTSAFSAEEIELMNKIMGPTLARYGYDRA